MIMRPSRGSRIDLTHPLSFWLVAAWIFNEGIGTKTYAEPYQSERFAGTFVNTPEWDIDGIDFTETADDYIDMPDQDIFDGSTTEWSVVTGITPHTSGASYPRIISNITSPNVNLHLGIHSGNDKPYIHDNTNTYCEFPNALTMDTYCVIGASQNSTYHDGVAGAWATSPAGAGGNGVNPLHIGVDASGGTWAFDGVISFVFVWRRNLSDHEFMSMYRDAYQMFRRPSVAPWFGGLSTTTERQRMIIM